MSCAAAVGLRYAQNCTIFDATVISVFSPDDTIIATVAPVLITGSTHYAMKTHIYMPDCTHSVEATLATVFYEKSCVL